jgi:hypothetical protein
MKFRYYITDLFEGSISGTDKRSVAEDLAQSEEYFVVDSKTGEWMETGGVREEVCEFNAEKE